MSAWPGKFVIGLTGNIATGKSVVRKMLEHVGAFGIDADALSHRAIQVGAPGYQAVIDAFGKFLVEEDGQIDRSRLGQVVFSDPQALALLESIIHPLVRKAVDVLISKSSSRVVVIEAIKLLESPLRDVCDVIWVTTSDEGQQMLRLQQNRDLTPEQAKQRMAAQSAQEEKVSYADTVILNNASIESTWDQVKAAWKLLFPEMDKETQPAHILQQQEVGTADQGLRVIRARPKQAGRIADFLAIHWGDEAPSQEEVMVSFGEKAYLLLEIEETLTGLLGWKVENLVARVDDITLSPDISFNDGLPYLMYEVEEASRALQCEIALIFVEPALAQQEDFWIDLGYQRREIETLEAGAWQEAAIDSFKEGNVMLFKQLRSDRVLRPI